MEGVQRIRERNLRRRGFCSGSPGDMEGNERGGRFGGNPSPETKERNEGMKQKHRTHQLTADQEEEGEGMVCECLAVE